MKPSVQETIVRCIGFLRKICDTLCMFCDLTTLRKGLPIKVPKVEGQLRTEIILVTNEIYERFRKTKYKKYPKNEIDIPSATISS